MIMMNGAMQQHITTMDVALQTPIAANAVDAALAELVATLGSSEEARCVAEFVAVALAGRWADAVAAGAVRVMDLSGFGGSKVCKLSAQGLNAVMLKVRVTTPGARGHTDLEDVANEARISAAAALFGSVGVGPVRIAEGGNWSIEEFGGIPLSAYHRARESAGTGGALERDAPQQLGEVRRHRDNSRTAAEHICPNIEWYI
eukprot:SAG11_NODE_8596_length_997_cov_1.090200_1_plen_201_part_01